MPIYEFKCDHCDYCFERIMPNYPPILTCPMCEWHSVFKQPSAPSFKITGFTAANGYSTPNTGEKP